MAYRPCPVGSCPQARGPQPWQCETEAALAEPICAYPQVRQSSEIRYIGKSMAIEETISAAEAFEAFPGCAEGAKAAAMS